MRERGHAMVCFKTQIAMSLLSEGYLAKCSREAARRATRRTEPLLESREFSSPKTLFRFGHAFRTHNHYDRVACEKKEGA
jgi:hypothetical protein